MRCWAFIFRARDFVGKFAGTHPATFEQAHRCTSDCYVDIFALKWILIFVPSLAICLVDIIFIVTPRLHKIAQETICLFRLFLAKCFLEEAHGAFAHRIIHLANLTSRALPTITSAVASGAILSNTANKACVCPPEGRRHALIHFMFGVAPVSLRRSRPSLKVI